MTVVSVQTDEDQTDIINLLKEALAQALEGKIKTLGVIACLEEGFATVMAGRNASALNLGCDQLKYRILTKVTEGTEERLSRRSSILKPGHA